MYKHTYIHKHLGPISHSVVKSVVKCMVTHGIKLIHDNYNHVYINNDVFVLLNSWIFSEKTRFPFWGNYFVE